MGAFVKEKRLALGLNQTELAKAAGISQTNVSEIERGHPKELEASGLIGLARVFKCDPRDIWHGKPTRIDRSALTDDEAELVSVYARLDPRDRQRLINTALAWLEDLPPGAPRPVDSAKH